MKDSLLKCAAFRSEEVTACSPAGRLSARVVRPECPSGAPPLVVLHGISRNAADLARLFAPEAARSGRALIVPYFKASAWPVFQRPCKAARPDQALLALLDKIAADIPEMAGPVEIFGHSGGAQLAHRVGMLYPHRFAGLHLAAAGWYCLPNDEMPYPYGLATPGDTAQQVWVRRMTAGLRDYLRLPMHVYVGSEDVTRDPALRMSRMLDKGQGRNRVERAQRFVGAVNAAAAAAGLASPARLIELPGCDHDVVKAITHNDLAARIVDARSMSD